MGDPATHLWTDTPLEINATHPIVIPYGTNFVDIVFEAYNDRGDLGDQVQQDEDGFGLNDHDAITASDQWTMSRNFTPSVICVSVDYNQFEVDDPNKSNALIGLVYPWAKRPALIERLEEYTKLHSYKIPMSMLGQKELTNNIIQEPTLRAQSCNVNVMNMIVAAIVEY